MLGEWQPPVKPGHALRLVTVPRFSSAPAFLAALHFFGPTTIPFDLHARTNHDRSP
jgi:hypothetical protein